MNVCVCSLATQAKDVDPLRRQNPAQSLGYLVYKLLQRKICNQRKIAGHLFQMIPWRDDHVAWHRGIPAEESDSRVSFANRNMLVTRFTAKVFANETLPRCASPNQ